MRHREVRQLLYEYARGELIPAKMRVVEDHIAGCNDCFGELQVMKEAIRIVPSRVNKPSEERSNEFWAGFFSRMENKARSEKARPVVSNPIWDEIWSVLTFRRPALLATAGIVVLAVIAVLLWTSAPVSEQIDEQSVQIVGGMKADSLRFELSNYFRNSKVLLVGISNISMEKGEHVNFSTERFAARKLIQQAHYLGNRAPDERSGQLMKALERILLELANMEDEVDLPDVEIVRAGIHQENMLFKIRMAESEFSSPDNSRIR